MTYPDTVRGVQAAPIAKDWRHRMKTDQTELFEHTPVRRAVLALILPTVISQIITVVYNMADTFFIGQMNDPDQVAAATLSLPLFFMLTGIANLFGIGGSSLISRSLGAGDRDKACQGAAFSIWAAAAAAAAYSAVIWLLRPALLSWLGADSGTYRYCADYVLWTTVLGGVPTVLSACLAHLVRAEGDSLRSSAGIAMGGILNIVLDPILIFGLGLGVMGAALATMLSNAAALLYFVLLILSRRGNMVIRFSPKHFTLGGRIPGDVLLVGFPSFLMMLMSTVSNLTLNKLVVSYSNQAIAGMGIAKKIDMLVTAVSNGMTQGVLPLIGYCYAAGRCDRMREAIKTAFLHSCSIAVGGAAALSACAPLVIRAFLADEVTVAYGQHFLRVICLTCPAVSITMMTICIFQATGQKGRPLLLSLLRKGGLDIPFMFLMNAAAGADGIPWATPISDALSMLTALALVLPYWHGMKTGIQNNDLPAGREPND